MNSKLRSEYLQYSDLYIDTWGLQAWLTSPSHSGGNNPAALSHDTDTGEGRGVEGAWVVDMVQKSMFWLLLTCLSLKAGGERVSR